MSQLRNNTEEIPIEFNICMIGLIMDRQKLYTRVNLRVDKMIREGLIEEVRRLLDMGYSKELVSMQGLGYKEIISYIEGQYSLEEAVDKLKQSTRHFAKRQLTWFRRDARIHWIDLDKFNNRNDIIENIAQYIAGKFNLV
jgi:tRNA dimethylallyltransferase